MKRFLIVGGAVAALVLGMVALGLMARFARDRQQRLTDEQVRAEREADRAEARAAFTAPVAPTPDEEAEFGRFFTTFGTALDREDAAAAAACFDCDRAAAEIARHGVMEKLGLRPTARNREDMARGMRAGIGRTLVENELLRWTSTRVRAVRWADGRREAVVIVTHTEEVNGDGVDIKFRWWLVAAGGGWRVYDFEDLDIGGRFSHMAAAAATPEVVRGGEAALNRMKGAMAAVRAAAVAVARQDADGAERAIAPARGVSLPDPFAAMRELVEAGIRVARRDHAGALDRLDAADRLHPGMPCARLLRAMALNQAERYEDALAQCRAYVAELGPEAVVCEQAGFALEGLNRPAEAATEYRAALDAAPNRLDSLFGLRRVLPADQKAEVGERLAKARDPLRDFDNLVNDARDDGDAAGEAALMAGLRKVKPDDPRLAREDVRALVKDGKLADAAALVRRVVGDAPADPRPPVVSAYLDAMLDAGKAVEALAGVPRAHAGKAFQFLASDLEDRLFDADPKADPPDPAFDQLAALVAARRKAVPRDPWVGFYEAVGLDVRGKHEEAAKGFAAATAALANWDGPMTDYDKDTFRERRVGALYSAKQGMKAYAEVGPPAKTFRQLAHRHVGSRDADGLAALIAAHAAREPGDAALEFFRGELHYFKAEYAAAARRFAAFRAATPAPGGDPSPGVAADLEIRARVRVGDAAGARAVLNDLPADRRPVTLRAIVAAAGGDADEVGRLMGELATPPGGVGFLYRDEDFGRLIAAPAFDEVRRRHPDPAPRPAGPTG